MRRVVYLVVCVFVAAGVGCAGTGSFRGTAAPDRTEVGLGLRFTTDVFAFTDGDESVISEATVIEWLPRVGAKTARDGATGEAGAVTGD